MNSTEVTDAGNEKNESILLVEILIEILSRLPTSSLLRFKLVCKLWLSLITNEPVLAKLHFDRGFKSTGPSIIILSEARRLFLMDDEGGHKHLVFSSEEPFQGISPSCNGVLCVYGKYTATAMLINPTTLEELALPKPPDADTFSQFFLGYLPATNKFKVVRFSDLPTQCDILTVGTCSWRQITVNCIATSMGIPITNGGVSINGFMYWIAGSWETNTLEIMSLDLNLERFGTIEFQEFLHGPDHFTEVEVPTFLHRPDLLSEVEGQLCVVLVRVSVEIWMLENNTSHVWTKRYNLSFPGLFDRPILILQEKILIKSYKGLHYLDLQTGRETSGKIIRDRKWYPYQVQLHIESLVRLKDL